MKLLWRTALVGLAAGALFAACSGKSATTPPAGAAAASGHHPFYECARSGPGAGRTRWLGSP
jgi:ABC-type glycerol-3-phosphate transport system substrate-binding protein